MSADRVKRLLRGFFLQVAIILVTLGVAELILRTIDLRYLREGQHRGYKVVYHYDPEIGWAPIPN